MGRAGAQALKALVTGGGGFLGGALARRLIAEGHTVRSLARGDYPALAKAGAEVRRGDLSDAGAVDAAVAGVDVVFHVGAKAGVWGPYEEYRLSNVVGTENVLASCRRHGVRKLVFTSSPSVVCGRDLENADESTPIPKTFAAHYPATKAAAERAVLAANGPELSTVALRPHLIWGPGDNHILPRLKAQAEKGALRKISGRPCLVDATYIDNAVDAHMLAAERLSPGAPCAGKAYFISNGEPTELWTLIWEMLKAVGAPPPMRAVSPRMAHVAGAVLEALYTILPLSGEPRMTRFMAEELTTHHYFNLTAARRDLGYVPKVSTKDGLKLLS